MSHRLGQENPALINGSAAYDFSARPKDGETYFVACASVGIRDGSPLATFNSKLHNENGAVCGFKDTSHLMQPLNPRYWVRGQCFTSLSAQR
jgi:hypothetical protein